MSECLFCKMVARQIQPDIVYEDQQLLAFRDLHPQAPVHVLLIPKLHIATLNDLQADQAGLAGRLLLAAARVASDLGIAQSGFRTVMNCNADGGQTVFHLHLHLLGGRGMAWPPG
ncbi:MAG: histidine triad nucleotide-binding protein [Gammaproteobacteria bacterium]|nr:histidine triad nucleotide-binding protein [Gammaproteobacteria bacterium]